MLSADNKPRLPHNPIRPSKLRMEAKRRKMLAMQQIKSEKLYT